MFRLISISGNIRSQELLYRNEFPLSDVTLLDGPFKHARDLNIQTLLKYDVDLLLAQRYIKLRAIKNTRGNDDVGYAEVDVITY